MSRRGTGRVGTSRKWLHSRRQRSDISLVSASASMRRTRGSKRRLALPNGIDTVIGDAQDMRDRSDDGRTGLLWGLIPVLRALRTRSSHGTLSNQVACSRRLATEDRMGRAPGMRGKLRRALRGARKRFAKHERAARPWWRSLCARMGTRRMTAVGSVLTKCKRLVTRSGRWAEDADMCSLTQAWPVCKPSAVYVKQMTPSVERR